MCSVMYVHFYIYTYDDVFTNKIQEKEVNIRR